MKEFKIKSKGKAIDLGLKGILPIRQEKGDNGKIIYVYEDNSEFGKILKQVDKEFKERKCVLKIAIDI